MRYLLHAMIAGLLAVLFCTAASAQGVCGVCPPSTCAPTCAVPGAPTCAAPCAPTNIIDTLAATGRYTQFLTALNKAGLTQTLQGPGPFTVFAPTDDAFQRVDTCQLNTLLMDCNALRNVLLYHVAYGYLPVENLRRLKTLGSIQGSAINISARYRKVRVNKVNIIQPDICASNGIIQSVDRVLLTPGCPVGPTCSDPIATLTAQAGCSSYTTFLRAVDAAGLTSLLRASYPITVMAPTDAAFARLTGDCLNALMCNPVQLRQVLLLHLAPGTITARDAQRGTPIATFLGLPVTPQTCGNCVTLAGAPVVRWDLRSGNDMIQALDAVLLPRYA